MTKFWKPLLAIALICALALAGLGLAAQSPCTSLLCVELSFTATSARLVPALSYIVRSIF